MRKRRNIVLFVGPYTEQCFLAVRDLEKYLGYKLKIGFIMSKSADFEEQFERRADFIIRNDIKKIGAIERELMPYKDKVLVVTCRSEFYLTYYMRLIALFPNLIMPTFESVGWSINKLQMRRKFQRYYPEITPSFVQVYGATKEDMDAIRNKVGFPCIVKPASLAASRLVSVCYHDEELQSTLKKTFSKMAAIYKETGSHVEPEVIVEQFMEGDMYTMDAYADNTGMHIKHLPATHVKTGQNIGVDDFFGYRHVTPTNLSEESIKRLQDVAQKAIFALGLRACMVHMEFIRMDETWKVLEITPRMGGHRDLMYRQAFGIPHGLNDLLVRMGEKPIIKKKVKKHIASFNIFPYKTGRIKAIQGIKRVQELASLVEFEQVKKVGERAGLSKNGFKKVLDISLANVSREALFADVRRLEQVVNIEIE